MIFGAAGVAHGVKLVGVYIGAFQSVGYYLILIVVVALSPEGYDSELIVEVVDLDDGLEEDVEDVRRSRCSRLRVSV